MRVRTLSVGGSRRLGARFGVIAAAVVLLGVAYPTAASAATPTTTTLSPNPANPVTNQTVMLTATVTASSGTPTGTVAFADNSGTITSCNSVPLSPVSTTSATASCQISYAASQSPEVLGAQYTPNDLTFQGSGTTNILTIARDSTATALGVLNPNPGPSQGVAYFASVTPGHPGPTSPSGTVAFFDGATPIAGCASLPVTGGGATCTTSYSAPGSHSITVAYFGDGNFVGSTSGPQTVTVSTTPTGAPPANCTSAYNEGFNTGFNSGFDSGFASGYRSGFRRGFTRGFNSGFAHSGRLAAFISSPSAREAQAIPPECTQTYNQAFNTAFNPGFKRGFNPGYNPGFKAGFKSGFNAGRRARHRRHRPLA